MLWGMGARSWGIASVYVYDGEDVFFHFSLGRIWSWCPKGGVSISPLQNN